jgi:hypothetical protein
MRSAAQPPLVVPRTPRRSCARQAILSVRVARQAEGMFRVRELRATEIVAVAGAVARAETEVWSSHGSDSRNKPQDSFPARSP